MATLNISIPEEMKAWIENQTRIGLYSNSSDYIRDLIRKDQKKRGATQKIPVDIFGNKITVIGDFGAIAIIRDISLRGGTPIPDLQSDTKYVLCGNLSASDEMIVAEAESRAIPCISLDHYKSQLPDSLEMRS